MKLELLDFIRENKDWEIQLQDKPYSLSIKRDSGYILFMYSQIDSDFSYRLVRECRGIILREFDMTPVCIPFTKFFNVQESHASDIDWSTARVQEKIDGSIIKLWFDNDEWHISTNGTIDAVNAPLSDSALLMDGCKYANYSELFSSVFPQELYFHTLDVDCTYIFELVSPYNRIVVPYEKTEIYHIGTRDNRTLEELDIDIGIRKPKEYSLSSLEDCLYATGNMDFDEEGYVAVDANWNRVKIKSPAYVAAHHLKNNGVVTYSRIVDMIRLGGQDDFLSIYPEYTDAFENVLERIDHFVTEIISDWNEISSVDFITRKELAKEVLKTSCPSCMFSLYDEKHDSVAEWFWNQANEKILKYIGLD